MGLTGAGTLWCSVIGFVLVTAGACLAWDRVRSPLRWPARVGLLLTCDLAAVLVVALVLNSAFDFYPSWSELLGRHPSLAVAAAVPGSQDARWRTRLAGAAHADRGLVVPLSIVGAASGIGARPAAVYLPAEYGDPRFADVRFPVIELLDGYPGSPRSWLGNLGIAAVLDRGIASGQFAPAVVVMPTQNVDSPRDTECANVVGGPQVDTYLSEDVRTAVERAFRVSDSGQDWAVAGYSTGGYCAAVLAAQHRGLFAAAASIEGYNAAAHDRTTGSLFRSDRASADQADLLWWVGNRPAAKVPLLAMATRQDPQSWSDDQILDRAAIANDWPVSQLTLPRGGHNFATFAAEVPLALNWLMRRLGPPLAPTPSIDGLVPQPVQPAAPRHQRHEVRIVGARSV